MPSVVLTEENNEDDIEATEDDGSFFVDDILIPGPIKPRLTFDPDGPRLIITHIECENFKSYAGRHVMGPFHKNFTCIMGQNGSGKSNVIDSLLFVFGIAAKKIRSTKIAKLIHSSKNYPNLTSCKVTVFFSKIVDQGEEFVTDKKDAIAISRTAYQNSSSFYEINGKKKTFNNIKDLLKKNGIDLLFGRFLILQGEVEQISLMKPKAENENTVGMLEYLEDVIDTARYVEPMKKLEEKMLEYEKQRSEKVVAVKFVEEQLEKLEEPWNKAIKFLKDSNRHTILQHRLVQVKIMEHNEQLDEAKAVKEKIDEENQALQEKFKEAEEEIQKKKAVVVEYKKKTEEAENKCEDLKETLLNLNSEDAKLRMSIKHSDEVLKNTKTKIKEQEKLKEKYKDLPEKNSAKLVEIKRHKEKLEVEKAAADEEYAETLATLKGETDGLQKEKEKFEKERLSLQAGLNKAQDGVNLAKSKLDIFGDAHEKAKKRYEEMKTEFKKSSDKVSALSAENGELIKQVSAGKKQLESAKREYEAVKEPAQNIERDFFRAQQHYREMQSTYENSKSRNRLLNELSRQRDLGNIPGFIGRLGDLATIDDKYDVAISTACGLLDYYLVDNDETGKMCVRFARENKLGIVNCILLSKQEHLKDKCLRPMNVPAGSHRLFDLLRVKDPNHKPAFYFALRDCLVVGTIDEGDRISKKGFGPYKRCRVVTLDGVLFETTGAFSGGGVAQRGRMKSTLPVSAEEVEHAKRQFEATTKERDQLVRKSTELQRKIEEWGRNVPEWEKKFKRNIAELKTLESMVDKLHVDLEGQKKRVASTTCDPVEKERLKAEFEEASSAFQQEKEQSDKLDEKIEKIKKTIKNINNKKMQSATEKRKDKEQKLKVAKSTIATLEAETATSERNYTKAEKAIENLQKALEEGQKKRELDTEQLNKNVEEAIAFKAKQDRCMERIKLGIELIQEHEKLLEKTKEAHNELRAQKVEVDNKIKNQNAVVNEIKAVIGGCTKEMNKLRLQDVPQSKRNRMFEEDDEMEGEALNELVMLSKEALKAIDKATLQTECVLEGDKIRNIHPNLQCVQDYQKQETVYEERSEDLRQVTAKVDMARNTLKDVSERRLNEFAKAMDIILSKLTLIYQQLTMGGSAMLEWVDGHDPFARGISFSVRPPEKSWKSITNLSGGEKTLSSLALVFALHFYRATPFYIMDEIDAALDCRNVSIIAEHVKAQTRNAQFIIISLRPRMSIRANYLMGVYKRQNVSGSSVLDVRNNQLISVENKQKEK